MDTTVLIIAIFIGIAVYLAIYIPYIYTLQNALLAVSPHNRKMEPKQTWLFLIPLFQIFWMILKNPAISESLKAEYEERGQPQEGDYGRLFGLLFPALNIIGLLPTIGDYTSLPTLLFFILFWVKISSLKNKLNTIPVSTESAGFRNNTSDLLDN